MRILILDDLECSGYIVKEQIKDMDVNNEIVVHTCTSYNDAILSVKNSSLGYDWLIADIDLGEKLNGLDFALKMSYKSPLTRVIIYTGKELTPELAYKMSQIPNCNYLNKPVKIDDITNIIFNNNKRPTTDTKMIRQQVEQATTDATQEIRITHLEKCHEEVKVDIKEIKTTMSEQNEKLDKRFVTSIKLFLAVAALMTTVLGVVTAMF